MIILDNTPPPCKESFERVEGREPPPLLLYPLVVILKKNRYSKHNQSAVLGEGGNPENNGVFTYKPGCARM